MGSWEFYTRNGPFHHWPLLTVFSSRHNLYSSSQLSPAEDPTCLHADNADTPVSLFTWTYPAPLLQAAATWTPLGSSRHVPWNDDLGPLDNEIQGFDVAMIFFWSWGGGMRALTWLCSLELMDDPLHGKKYDQRIAREELPQGWSPRQWSPCLNLRLRLRLWEL